MLKSPHVFNVGPRPSAQRTIAKHWNAFVSGIDWQWVNPKYLAVSSLLAAGIGYGTFVFGDGVGRPEIATTAKIEGVRHTPSYYSTEYYTDSNGNRQSRQVYHPDEYHAKISIPQSQDSKVLQVSSQQFRQLTRAVNSPTVFYSAVFREGRWSHTATWIDLKYPLQQASEQQRSVSLSTPVSPKNSW